VTLIEDDPKIFSIFLTWISTSNLEDAEELVEVIPPPNKSLSDNEKSECLRSVENRFDQLVFCFALGDSIRSYGFKNAVMDLMIPLIYTAGAELNKVLGSHPKAISLVYNNTPEGSMLRKLIVDTILCWIVPEEFVEKLPGGTDETLALPPDFLREILLRSMKERDDGSFREPSTSTLYRYHEHPDQPDRHSCNNSN